MSLDSFLLMLKGGFASGNWGHAGRPGKHGGSSPGAGHSRIGLKPGDTQTDKNLKVHLTRMDRVPGKKVNKPKEPEKKVEEKKTQSEKFNKVDEDKISEHYKDYGEKCVKAKDPGCTALNTYTGNDFEDINSGLRFNEPLSKNHQKVVNDIDKAMDEAPRTEESMIVYRSMAPGIVNSLIKEGSVFQDKAFVSTSIDPDATPGSANVEIRIPKGSKGIYVAGLSDYQEEKEFLLPRNAKFNVVTKSNGKAVLEFIGDD